MTADIISGYGFRPDLIETIDEAFERAGLDPATVTARHLQSARRSLNYILSGISTKNRQTWLVEELIINLSAGSKTVLFDEGVIDVISAVSRDLNGYDTPVAPVGRETYLAMPNKEQKGQRPDRIWVDRSSVDKPTGNVWPVPTVDGTLVLSVMKYAKTLTSFDKDPEIPREWQDALADLLSTRIAQKYNVDMLKACETAARRSEQLAKRASSEDAGVTITMATGGRRGRRR